MEDLAKFFADIIEFIVGGVLFLASLILLVTAFPHDSLNALSHDIAEAAPDDLGGGFAIAALAVVYAMGIVAEGISRVCFEWRLAQLTPKHFGTDDPVAERERQRLSVMDGSEKLDNANSAQLKRLRIERTLALSSALATLAFVIRLEWWFLGTLALTVAAALLVNERFKRYLKTIKASYSALVTRESRAQEAAG